METQALDLKDTGRKNYHQQWKVFLRNVLFARIHNNVDDINAFNVSKYQL